jgi:hypothetical protein
MIQFNLLPDVKLEYVKTQHTKRLLTVISVLVSVAGIAVLLLSIVSVDVVQKKSLRDLKSDINKYSNQLKSVNDLDKILTVQNQLGTLTTLHQQKPVASRLLGQGGYLSQVTPNHVTLDKLTVDFTNHTLKLGGTADSLDVVSTYTDTLKGTTYKTDAKGTGHAFSAVVLSDFSRQDSGITSFTINCTFDPVIFDSLNAVTLKVPSTADADQSSVFGNN